MSHGVEPVINWVAETERVCREEARCSDSSVEGTTGCHVQCLLSSTDFCPWQVAALLANGVVRKNKSCDEGECNLCIQAGCITADVDRIPWETVWRWLPSDHAKAILMVCKEWNSGIRASAQKLVWHSPRCWPHVCTLSAQFPHLRVLHLDCATGGQHIAALQGLRHLKELCLGDGAQTPWSELNKLTNLVDLHVRHPQRLNQLQDGSPTAAVQLNRLVCLHATSCTSWGDDDVACLSTHVRGIRCLELTGAFQVSCGGLTALTRFSELNALDLSQARVTDLGPHFSCMSSLRKLTMDGCAQLTHLGGVSALTGLVELSMHNCRAVLRSELLCLGGMLGLTSLELSGHAGFSDAHLRTLAPLSGLRHLHLISTGITSLAGVEALTALECLEAWGNAGLVAAHAVTPYLKPLRRLQRVELPWQPGSQLGAPLLKRLARLLPAARCVMLRAWDGSITARVTRREVPLHLGTEDAVACYCCV